MEELKNYIYDYIVIAFSDVKKAYDILKEEGVKKQKIVAYTFTSSELYKNNYYCNLIDTILHDELKDFVIPKLFSVSQKNFYLCTMNILESEIVESDFVREQTLHLLVNEIKRKNVKGNVAELGVFKGEFSKKINYLLSSKTLYLFDTFEGFDERDKKSDTSLTWGEILNKFDDTSVAEVLGKVPYPQKCVIKKVFFPNTFDLEKETFCFVSIDVDLYDPIKKGLELFYPRLEKGGYIMVHDYNNFVYKGTMNAVCDFCDMNGISYVPIPDIAGSIIITK